MILLTAPAIMRKALCWVAPIEGLNAHRSLQIVRQIVQPQLELECSPSELQRTLQFQLRQNTPRAASRAADSALVDVLANAASARAPAQASCWCR